MSLPETDHGKSVKAQPGKQRYCVGKCTTGLGNESIKGTRERCLYGQKKIITQTAVSSSLLEALYWSENILSESCYPRRRSHPEDGECPEILEHVVAFSKHYLRLLCLGGVRRSIGRKPIPAFFVPSIHKTFVKETSMFFCVGYRKTSLRSLRNALECPRTLLKPSTRKQTITSCWGLTRKFHVREYRKINQTATLR